MMACTPPAYVSVAGQRQRLVPPETPNVAVVNGQTIAIPLYDGNLARFGDWKPVLRYVTTISVPSYQCFTMTPYTAGSHRVALFTVIGHNGQKTFVPVRLTLAQMHERCSSCRMIHFFIRVK